MSGELVRVGDKGEGGCRVCDKDDDQEWTVFEGCVREGESRKSEGCVRGGGGEGGSEGCVREGGRGKSEGCVRSVNNQRLEAVRAWKQKY